jgi:hypothetical protein
MYWRNQERFIFDIVLFILVVIQLGLRIILIIATIYIGSMKRHA